MTSKVTAEQFLFAETCVVLRAWERAADRRKAALLKEAGAQNGLKNTAEPHPLLFVNANFFLDKHEAVPVLRGGAPAGKDDAHQVAQNLDLGLKLLDAALKIIRAHGGAPSSPSTEAAAEPESARSHNESPKTPPAEIPAGARLLDELLKALVRDDPDAVAEVAEKIISRETWKKSTGALTEAERADLDRTIFAATRLHLARSKAAKEELGLPSGRSWGMALDHLRGAIWAYRETLLARSRAST